MDTTSPSLLIRLRQPGEQDAWRRFVQMYTPLLFRWARRWGLRDQDAADMVQDVCVILMQKLPTFQYDPRRGFRNWLHTIALNKFSVHLQQPSLLRHRPTDCLKTPQPIHNG